jgi:hypothetical protein
MFTIKLYIGSGCRQVIRTAESFTILRGSGDETTVGAEITLHQKNSSEDTRVDILPEGTPRGENWPPYFQRAIIENAAGKTTEIIVAGPALKQSYSPPKAA